MKRLLILSMVLMPGYMLAQGISGKVTDTTGNPLPFTSVYLKGSTYGVATNTGGSYSLELSPGTHAIVYTYVGFESIVRKVTLRSGDRKVLNVQLAPSPRSIDVDVVAEREDLARKIMSSVRDHRREHLTRLESYTCETYLKTLLEKTITNPTRKDSLIADTSEGYFDPVKLNMIESLSRVSHKRPGRYKEEILGFRDYVHKWHDLGASVTIGINYGQDDIVPRQAYQTNPYLIYQDVRSAELNFYRSNIDFPAVSENPIRSPLAPGSGLHYKFEFIASYYQDDKKIYKLKVTPRNSTDALVDGIIYIQDSTWAIEAVDVKVNRSALYFTKELRIVQSYTTIDSVSIPGKRELHYTIRDGRHTITGHTQVTHTNYQINPDFEPGHFGNKVKVYQDSALTRDSSYWALNRHVPMNENERSYVTEADSIRDYYQSDEYYRTVDSAFNRIDPLWVWVTGIGHRWRKIGLTIYLGGIPEQINPFGIGGYRHKLPMYVTKEFNNGMWVTADYFVDYGFNNEDFKGKASVGWTYVPKKFVRTKLIFGSYYDQINNYASLEQTFSRSNYVHTRMYGIAQRMEVVNGLYAELSFEHSDQQPLTDLKLSKWSEEVFGELNEPVDFQRYIKSEIRLDVKYRFDQKYVITDKRKIILGTNYPELRFVYRKGLPNVLNSEVNFDYFEVGARDRVEVPRWGTSNWDVALGTFVNRTNLRVLEHKYFRGSDRWVFSNPLASLQLLGLTMETRNEFISGNYIHHFNGTILNKVPLLKKLRLGLAGGAGVLLINESSFNHFEMFGGVERVIRIKDQLLRLGVYAVTANNSLDRADFTIKFGLDFFDRWAKRWSY